MPYRFSFTAEIVRSLQTIEQARAGVNLTRLPPAIAEDLRQRARLRSTHFSTRIEGNRLTLAEAEQTILEGKAYPGRERDTLEVKRYFQAVQQVETWVEEGAAVTEERIRRLHALTFSGRRARPTPYRDGQNAIRNQQGELVYLPPEAGDVPALMAELVKWLQENEHSQPIPVLAGTAHYQFVTVHPFYDGNGRTARLLATWMLYRGGYDLGRFFALEEFYARDLEGYYAALVTHPHHNYYDGRAEAEITSWLAYFLNSMAVVFEAVAQEVSRQAAQGIAGDEPLLRKLDRRGRIVLGLFSRQEEITANEAAAALGLSPRQARELLRQWAAQGWLVVSQPSRKARRYTLSAEYRRSIWI